MNMAPIAVFWDDKAAEALCRRMVDTPGFFDLEPFIPNKMVTVVENAGFWFTMSRYQGYEDPADDGWCLAVFDNKEAATSFASIVLTG